MAYSQPILLFKAFKQKAAATVLSIVLSRNVPFFEGNRTHKPGTRTRLAVSDAHDDDSDTQDPAILAINRALTDDLLDHDLRLKISATFNTYDFARLGQWGKQTYYIEDRDCREKNRCV